MPHGLLLVTGRSGLAAGACGAGSITAKICKKDIFTKLRARNVRTEVTLDSLDPADVAPQSQTARQKPKDLPCPHSR